MRVYFIAVKGEHPEGRHREALEHATAAVNHWLDPVPDPELEAIDAVARAWMEEMPDPVDAGTVREWTVYECPDHGLTEEGVGGSNEYCPRVDSGEPCGQRLGPPFRVSGAQPHP